MADVSSDVRRWVVIVLVAVAIVLLLAYARRDPGFDDRVPDAEDAAAIIGAGVVGGGV